MAYLVSEKNGQITVTDFNKRLELPICKKLEVKGNELVGQTTSQTIVFGPVPSDAIISNYTSKSITLYSLSAKQASIERKAKALQEDINHGQVCPYCLDRTKFIDSKYLYSNGASYGMVWACIKCDAWVGIHKGTRKALGRLANAELREAKKEAHKWFDPLWKKKKQQGEQGYRNIAYKWLSEQLGINRYACHIGMFDVDQCNKVVEICKQYYKQ